MPAIAAGIASAISYALPFVIGTAGTATFSWVALGKAFLVGAALGLVFQALAPNSGGGAAYRSQARRLEFESVARRRVVLGEARVGGAVALMEVSGTGKTKTLHMVVVLGDGSYDSIQEVWIDGKKLTYTRAAGTSGEEKFHLLTGTGDYAGYFSCHEYFAADGSQGSACRTNTAADANFALNGVSWAYLQLTQNNYSDASDRVWKSARPRVEFVVRGLKFEYPGSNAGGEWTRNAAAIHYWRLKYRKRVSDQVIDVPSFNAAYAVCNETVNTVLPSSGYDNYKSSDIRYAIDGVVWSNEEEEGLIQEMNKAWGGHLVEHSGTYYFRPGVDRPATDHFGEKDIVSTGDFTAAPPLQERVNMATAKLAQSSAHDWNDFQVPYVRDGAAITSDGGEYRQDWGQFRFVSNPITLQRLISNLLKKARAAQTFQYIVYPGANFHRASLIPTDIITVSDERNGLSSERMEVQQVVINPDLSFGITLRGAPTGSNSTATTVPPKKDCSKLVLQLCHCKTVNCICSCDGTAHTCVLQLF